MNEIKDFPWRPGMLTADGERIVRVDDGVVTGWADMDTASWHVTSLVGQVVKPDFTDPATVGALAGAVRGLYDEPRMFAAAIPGGWAICRGAMHAMFEPDGLLEDGTWDCDFLGDAPKYMHADTEPEAWLAAYHAALQRQS